MGDLISEHRLVLDIQITMDILHSPDGFEGIKIVKRTIEAVMEPTPEIDKQPFKKQPTQSIQNKTNDGGRDGG